MAIQLQGSDGAISPSENSVHVGRWRRALKQSLASFLALSAAVQHEQLEQRNTDGSFQFARGRQKYYGLGSLVIFFAIFSGYGMGHMLASMSTISSAGAIIAGVVWALFQWCLERQILISIRHDAAWWKKLIGIGWRGALALMSASVMVYPFFVESNRAEIDVKVGEIARQRMLNSQSSAEAIAGVPRLSDDARSQVDAINKVEKAMRSEPPDIGVFKQKSKQCWIRHALEDEKLLRQLRPMRLMREGVVVDSILDSKIAAIEQKRISSKEYCQVTEQAIFKRVVEWRQEKMHERAALSEAHQLTQSQLRLAHNKQLDLSAEQEVKIKQAAKSGFAADFVAVAALVTDDPYRRFQLIWWLTWFLAIEMVAILIKFGTYTDLDLRYAVDERRFSEQTEQDQRIWRERQTTDFLRQLAQQKAEQAVWQNRSEELMTERLTQELMMEQEIARDKLSIKKELASTTNLLEVSLHELEKLDELKSRIEKCRRPDQAHSNLDVMYEKAQQELQAKFLKILTRPA